MARNIKDYSTTENWPGALMDQIRRRKWNWTGLDRSREDMMTALPNKHCSRQYHKAKEEDGTPKNTGKRNLETEIRGVRLEKNDFGSVFVFGSVLQKNCGFRSGFGFTKLTAVSVFGFGFLHCMLFNVYALYWVQLSRFRITFVCRCWRHLSFTPVWYDARNDILPCWFGPTNCQPKWLRTRSAEIRHEEKYFDRWTYHVARWTVNETTWKTVPKPPKSVTAKVGFLKTKLQKLSFRFLNFEVSSVQFGF